MVYMIIHSGSHEVVKIMGHDVKQFKSLEGFLESGPQFVLQAYIILLGQWSELGTHNISCEVSWLLVLLITTLMFIIMFTFMMFSDQLTLPFPS